MNQQLWGNVDKRTAIYCTKSTLSIIRKRLNDLYAGINDVMGYMACVQQMYDDGYICEDVKDKYLQKENERLDMLQKDVRESQIDIDYYTGLLNKVRGVEENKRFSS